ncbi:HlyD family efflux transporter periplasmic adaptor subunit [Actinomycetospora endophytica]|uniref:HlyD family efflux transporter periplasmic adaptor subunit n=1 Tax=Actinomycetospora endophytica TaxID=2291215 RepID=A0ABS8P2G7_9PSEU|nr:biotin/lipoyl-binding protein [Actinomycetospora endophytica]MCD2192187.1 HlyD family efflux transporter periplasmic adaptor subunit [Actinomycetospora endophytica]
MDSTGSVSSLGSSNLGFPTAGQLTSVRVKVGDRVTAGQVLATVDDFAARRALQQARAQLAGQQAQYDKVADGTSVEGAQNSVNAAASVVSATKRQVDATLAADDAAISAAQTAPAGAGAAAAGGDTSGGSEDGATGAAAGAAGPATGAMGAATSAATSAASTAQSVAQARAKRQADAAAGDVQIADARQGQVTAQNGLDSAGANRPNDLAAARAAVDGARAQVATAQQNLANTTLRAPSDGTITALNGAVGEFVAASAATTPIAPGTDAAIPGAAQAANGAAAAAAAAGGASPSRPGGTQFMVLQDLTRFAVVVPFQEVDAEQIAPQQHVDVSLDAVPDGPLDGTVLSVAPSATAISGSIEYYVTVALPPDPRIHDGQSARATVITADSGPTISVPNRALHRQGNATTVTVVTSDGRQVVTPVTTGIAGPDRTQITGGLAEGQQVVVGGTS